MLTSDFEVSGLVLNLMLILGLDFDFEVDAGM